MRYDLNSKDTTVAKNNAKLKELTCDLQTCLPSPLTTNRISFYKRKLLTLIIFCTMIRIHHCVMWMSRKELEGEMKSHLQF